MVVEDRARARPGARRGRDRPARGRAQPARPARGRGRLAGRDGSARARLGRRGGRARARRRRERHRRGRRGGRCCPRSTGATIRACSGRPSASSAGPTTARSPSRCACRRPTSSPSRPGCRSQHAAALPLAGLTVWRALFTRGGLQSGQSVLVLGAGAGTSTFAVQFARAAGARVFVTSGSASKITRSLELGAEAGFDYTEEGWEQERRRAQRWRRRPRAGLRRHVAVERACVRAGGRVVVFGGTAGTTAELDVRGFYFKQIDVVGTMMGSPVDFRALLRACETADLDADRGLRAPARRGRVTRSAGRRRASSSASSC